MRLILAASLCLSLSSQVLSQVQNKVRDCECEFLGDGKWQAICPRPQDVAPDCKKIYGTNPDPASFSSRSQWDATPQRQGRCRAGMLACKPLRKSSRGTAQARRTVSRKTPPGRPASGWPISRWCPRASPPTLDQWTSAADGPGSRPTAGQVTLKGSLKNGGAGKVFTCDPLNAWGGVVIQRFGSLGSLA
jgi:hypothetical protein